MTMSLPNTSRIGSAVWRVRSNGDTNTYAHGDSPRVGDAYTDRDHHG